MEEELPSEDECMICGEKYTPDVNIPLLLQCGHTFCHGCVRLVLAVTVPHNNTTTNNNEDETPKGKPSNKKNKSKNKTTNNKKSGDNDDDDNNTVSTTPQQEDDSSCVECMICKQTTTLLGGGGSSPIENRLPHNIALLAQIAAKRADPKQLQQQPQQQSVVCDDCEKPGAEMFCVNCGLNFCPSCFGKVHSGKGMRTHQSTPLANKHLEMCLVHNQKLCLVCVECGDKPICLQCVHTTCSKHTRKEFASVMQDKVESVHKLHEDMQKHLQNLEKEIDATKTIINQVTQEKEAMVLTITTTMQKMRLAVDKAQQELLDQASKLFDAKKKSLDCHTQHLKTIRGCVGALITSKQSLPLDQITNQIQTQPEPTEASWARGCATLSSWAAQATNLNHQCKQLCQSSSQPHSLIRVATHRLDVACSEMERVLVQAKVGAVLWLDPRATQVSNVKNGKDFGGSCVSFATAPRWKAAQCVATSPTFVKLVWESGLGEEWAGGEEANQLKLEFRVVLKESIPYDHGQGSCKTKIAIEKPRIMVEGHQKELGKVVFEGKNCECDVTNLQRGHRHVFELCGVYNHGAPPVYAVCADKIVVCTPSTPEWLGFESISTDGVRLTNNRTTLTRDATASGGTRFGIGKELPHNSVVKWKLRIFKSSSHILCGIISTNTKGNDSYSSESSFTWYQPGCSFPRGQQTNCGGWVGWQSGDEAVMTLDGVNNTLTVDHSRRVGTRFTMGITPNLRYRIHVITYNEGDCVELVEA